MHLWLDKIVVQAKCENKSMLIISYNWFYQIIQCLVFRSSGDKLMIVQYNSYSNQQCLWRTDWGMKNKEKTNTHEDRLLVGRFRIKPSLIFRFLRDRLQLKCIAQHHKKFKDWLFHNILSSLQERCRIVCYGAMIEIVGISAFERS